MRFVYAAWHEWRVPLMAMLFVVMLPYAARAQVTSAPWISEVVPQGPPQEIIPNDPKWDRQWYLRQIGMPKAWAVTTGTRNIIVAVIDGGVDITHPDLRENIWVNQREVPWDGLDNDGNGYVDDVHGWNYIADSADVRPVLSRRHQEDAWSHGTMVASLIGAKGDDGVGMAGVAWNVRILPLVVLDETGVGKTSNLIEAMRYAVNQGASVINLSVVGYERDPALEEMLARVADAGVMVVAATGNDQIKQGVDIDARPAYPACSDLERDAVIGVGGTDVLDQHAPFSNFGKQCTDLSAPAHALLVARPSFPHRVDLLPEQVSHYREGVIGTSLAAPLVSGAIALLKSLHPEWSPAQLRERLYRTADSLDGSVPLGTKGAYGFGRLNIAAALVEPHQDVGPVTLAVVSSTPLIVSAATTATMTEVKTVIKPKVAKKLLMKKKPARRLPAAKLAPRR